MKALEALKDFITIRLGGAAGVLLKNVSGVAQFRNAGDTADAGIKVSALQVSGGTLGANKVLTSDGSGNATWQAEQGITALTGDVTASGPGSVAATVAKVGGATAVNVADAVTKKHAQNSDTGTTSASFGVDTGGTGFKLKDVSGVAQVRNLADSADAGIKASAIQLTTGAAPGSFLQSDASGNASWQPDPGQAMVPIGAIILTAGTGASGLWRVCDGVSLLRGDYPVLFTILGTTYGSVDNYHFNLPDLRGRFPIGNGQGTGLTNRVLGVPGGEETHVLSASEMPTHSHVNTGANPVGTANGLVNTSGTMTGTNYGVSAVNSGLRWEPVSEASQGSGAAHNNMPPYLPLNYIIRCL